MNRRTGMEPKSKTIEWLSRPPLDAGRASAGKQVAIAGGPPGELRCPPHVPQAGRGRRGCRRRANTGRCRNIGSDGCHGGSGRRTGRERRASVGVSVSRPRRSGVCGASGQRDVPSGRSRHRPASNAGSPNSLTGSSRALSGGGIACTGTGPGGRANRNLATSFRSPRTVLQGWHR